MIKSYFSNIGAKRIIVMVVGNIFLGMGVSIFKFAQLGNDAYNGMIMSLADLGGIGYATLYMMLSICLFVVELLAGRKYIGIGTIINMFLNGYVTTFFNYIWNTFFPNPEKLFQQIPVMLMGVIIISLGLSLYQKSEAGVSPYDSLSLILAERFRKVPYFGWRVSTDAICALICFLTGGLVGIGMLVAAFCLGPVVHFFDVHLTAYILKMRSDTVVCIK